MTFMMLLPLLDDVLDDVLLVVGLVCVIEGCRDLVVIRGGKTRKAAGSEPGGLSEVVRRVVTSTSF